MLISVIVATYNCEHFIEDALNSVLNQTYKNIELIITDDCSTDNSVQVATNWIEKNKNRFYRTIQTNTSKNSGVTVNYNTGLHEAKGEWIKCLDGDDILPEDAVETYVNICKLNPNYTIWYSSEQAFDNNGISDIINHSTLPNTTAKKQMIYILNHRLLGVCTATNFIHRNSFLSLGGFDCKYPMYQDGSPFLKTLAIGRKIGIINKVTLLKRYNPNSLMHIANPIMVKNIRDCHFEYCRFYLKYGMPLHFYNSWVTYWLSTHNTSKWYIKFTGYILRFFDIINLVNKTTK